MTQARDGSARRWCINGIFPDIDFFANAYLERERLRSLVVFNGKNMSVGIYCRALHCIFPDLIVRSILLFPPTVVAPRKLRNIMSPFFKFSKFFPWNYSASG